MSRNQKTESKELQLKNWHLKKMIGTKNSEAKRSTKKNYTLNKWPGSKNGKQKTPSEKVASKKND